MLTLKELASASKDRRRRVLQARVEVLAENHALLRKSDAFSWTAADESRRLDCRKWRRPSSCQQSSSVLVPAGKSGLMGVIEVKRFDPGLDRTSRLGASPLVTDG